MEKYDWYNEISPICIRPLNAIQEEKANQNSLLERLLELEIELEEMEG